MSVMEEVEKLTKAAAELCRLKQVELRAYDHPFTDEEMLWIFEIVYNAMDDKAIAEPIWDGMDIPLEDWRALYQKLHKYLNPEENK